MKTNSFLSTLCALWIALVGCSGDSAPSSTAPSKTAANSAGSEDHKHSAPHGGLVATSGDRHLELRILGPHLDIFFLDEAEKTLPTTGVMGTVKVALGGNVQEYTFTTHEDHLGVEIPALALSYACPMHPEVTDTKAGKCSKCSMDLVAQEKPIVVLASLNANGKTYSARFAPTLGKDSGDAVPHQHDARQGGQVGMFGERHIEVVWQAAGEYRVYLSDDHRTPLSPKLATDAKLTIDPESSSPEVLPLTPDPSDAFLQAKGKADRKAPLNVKVSFTADSKPVEMEFLLSPK